MVVLLVVVVVEWRNNQEKGRGEEEEQHTDLLSPPPLLSLLLRIFISRLLFPCSPLLSFIQAFDKFISWALFFSGSPFPGSFLLPVLLLPLPLVLLAARFSFYFPHIFTFFGALQQLPANFTPSHTASLQT